MTAGRIESVTPDWRGDTLAVGIAEGALVLSVTDTADFDDDPRLGSAKVTHKLRDELRAAGHHCDALFADGIGRSPANRQVRQLVAPALASKAIRRASSPAAYDVVDAASAEGLWFGPARRLRGARRPALICRSNGLEHLNYQRRIDDSRRPSRPKDSGNNRRYARKKTCAARMVTIGPAANSRAIVGTRRSANWFLVIAARPPSPRWSRASRKPPRSFLFSAIICGSFL